MCVCVVDVCAMVRKIYGEALATLKPSRKRGVPSQLGTSKVKKDNEKQGDGKVSDANIEKCFFNKKGTRRASVALT